MNSVVITSIIFGAVTAATAAVKIYLGHKVKDMDGLGCVHTGEDNIIAYIGDENMRKKGI